jgi:hypothetical protein
VVKDYLLIPILTNSRYVTDRKLTRLAHVIRCAPKLRELHIEHDLDYARALSSNAELGILLATKLDVFRYTTKEAESSLGDLARLVDVLFSHSTAPPRLKELTLNIDGHPSAWLSMEHLVQWISQLAKRFPALIHFTLYCQPIELYERDKYSLTRLVAQRSLTCLLGGRIRTGPIEYRSKPHSLDIWL